MTESGNKWPRPLMMAYNHIDGATRPAQETETCDCISRSG